MTEKNFIRRRRDDNLNWHEVYCPECTDTPTIRTNSTMPPTVVDCFDHMEEEDVIKEARKTRVENEGLRRTNIFLARLVESYKRLIQMHEQQECSLKEYLKKLTEIVDRAKPSTIPVSAPKEEEDRIG